MVQAASLNQPESIDGQKQAETGGEGVK